MNETDVKSHRRISRTGRVIAVRQHQRQNDKEINPVVALAAGAGVGVGGLYLLNKRLGNTAGASQVIQQAIKSPLPAPVTKVGMLEGKPVFDGVIRFINKNGKEEAMDASLIVGSMARVGNKASGQSEAFLNRLYDDVAGHSYGNTPLNQHALSQLDIIADGAKARGKYAATPMTSTQRLMELESSSKRARELRREFVQQRRQLIGNLATNPGSPVDQEFVNQVDALYRDKMPELYRNKDMVLGGPHGRLLNNPDQALRKLANETNLELDRLVSVAAKRNKNLGIKSARQGKDAAEDLAFLNYTEQALKDPNLPQWRQTELKRQLRDYKFLHQITPANYAQHKERLEQRVTAYRRVRQDIARYAQGRNTPAANYFTDADAADLQNLQDIYELRHLLSRRGSLLAEYQRDPLYARYLLESGQHLNSAAYTPQARAAFYGTTPKQLSRTRQQPVPELLKDDLGRTQLLSRRSGIKTTFSAPHILELSYR